MDLPNLSVRFVGRWFGAVPNSGYQVAVVRGLPPDDIIYTSAPGRVKALIEAPDSGASLLRLSPGTSFDALAPGPTRFFHRVVPTKTESAPKPFRSGDGWRLVVRHEAGSLEAAVANARIRNVLISGGSLFLLAAAIAVLLIATNRAQSLAKAQIGFVAGVSHELKSPLAVIRTAGYNLSRGVVPDWTRVREYGSTIRAEALRLTETIDRAMRYASFESRKDPLVRDTVELSRVVEAAVAECTPMLHHAGLEVQFRVDPDVPPIRADAGAVQHCIQNLLSNAAKYAAGGELVIVQLIVCGREVQLWVEDRGPGIHPDDLPNIFEAFYRGRTITNSGVQGGVGLGLTLVERIMRAHDGCVSVHSLLGAGTRFILHFPALQTA